MELVSSPRVARARRLATDRSFRREWRELRRPPRPPPHPPRPTRRLATDRSFRREWRELRRLSRLAPYTPGSTRVAGPDVRFTHPQAFVAQYRAMFHDRMYAAALGPAPYVLDVGANYGLATIAL